MSANAAVDVVARLKVIRARAATVAPRAAVTAMSLTALKATQLELTRTSHPAGTPTPSRPGDPPSLVTGTLRRSIVATPAISAGPARYLATVGGTVIYARIQELGGTAGRGSVLPARPYLRPATEKLASSGTLTAVAAKAWTAALGI
jgi:phage gpG-like protein